MTSKTIRMFTAAAVSFALSVPAVAFACGGKEGRTSRFQQDDKNNDGYLTQAEVGAERWERIKVADANNDGRVSRDEMIQAFKAGKLGKRHGQKSAA